MANERTNAQNQNYQFLIYCPITCKQVMANNWKQISISGKQVTWWHCPECTGWHVVMEKREKPLDITYPLQE